MLALGSILDQLSNNLQLSQIFIFFKIITSELLQYLDSQHLDQTLFQFLLKK